MSTADGQRTRPRNAPLPVALADPERAIQVDPESVDGHRCRAEAYRERGDLEAAPADATNAIEIDPAEAAAHAARGNTLDDLQRTEGAGAPPVE